MMREAYDIVIVGAGMVGASMACALADTDFNIAVIEAFEPNAENQPSFDERTVALTYSSRLIFNALDVWADIDAEAFPILNIEVTNKDAFGFTTLGVEDSQTPALGYVVPTRAIGRALHKRISVQSNLDLLCPATVESIQPLTESANVVVNHADNQTGIKAKLVILADGGRSGLLQQLEFSSNTKTYPQCALVGIVSTDKPHQGKAFEHFTDQGPLALLPLRTADYALAWTLKEAEAKSLVQCDEKDFLSQLQSTFGKRAGQFKTAGRRHVYPLSLSMLDQPYKPRIVIIGNAAHTVHPVAGQGFNLGLRDVGFLQQTLLAHSHGDPGASELLHGYADQRKHDAKSVGQFTDGLIQIFNSDFFPLRAARNLGLSTINLLPGVKKGLLKRTMGLHGRQSQLAIRGKQTR